MWEAPPRFLTECIVGCFHLFQWKTSAIGTVCFPRPTPSIHNIILSWFISRIDTHLVPFTMVKFHKGVGIQNIVIIWNNTFGRKNGGTLSEAYDYEAFSQYPVNHTYLVWSSHHTKRQHLCPTLLQAGNYPF